MPQPAKILQHDSLYTILLSFLMAVVNRRINGTLFNGVFPFPLTDADNKMWRKSERRRVDVVNCF